MELFGINLVGILVATFIGMVLGALWYSPILFGKQWLQRIGKTPDTLGSTTLPMIGSVIANLMTAVGVSILFSFVGVDSLFIGTGVGLTLGFLIIFPALLSDNLFCGWGNQLLLIQSGYRVLSVLLISIALVYLS
jgi:uncharacterized protein DUF1761